MPIPTHVERLALTKKYHVAQVGLVESLNHPLSEVRKRSTKFFAFGYERDEYDEATPIAPTMNEAISISPAIWSSGEFLLCP